jgi:hypothetical protein
MKTHQAKSPLLRIILMKTMLLPLIACTCFSLTAMENKIIPIQPESHIAPANPPPYTYPGPISQMIQTYEKTKRQNIRPHSIMSSRIPQRYHQSNQQCSLSELACKCVAAAFCFPTDHIPPSSWQCSASEVTCKCAAVTCFIPAAILNGLYDPCCNKSTDPDDQCHLTKALIHIAYCDICTELSHTSHLPPYLEHPEWFPAPADPDSSATTQN